MKKKLFSKLLMGAVLLASMSSFVSCKDYDDDIQNLQEQINKAALKTELTTLEERLASVQSTASDALTKAEKALTQNEATNEALAAVKATADQAAKDVADAIEKANAAAAAAAAAQQTADNANTAAGKAQSTADDAAKAAAEAKSVATAAQNTADKAVADAAAAAAEAAAAKSAAADAASKSELEAALKRIGDLELQIATANNLEARVKALEDAVKALPTASGTQVTYKVAKVGEDGKVLRDEEGNVIEEEVTATVDVAIAAAHARANQYQASVDALWSAVTTVSLYVAGGQYAHGNRPVAFLNTIEKASVKFPLDSTVADAQVEFTKDKKVTYVDTVVIRVSPTNAQLTADMITLINSQGTEVDTSLVKVQVFPYEDVLTRGAISSNGLWKVALTLKDNYTKEEFNAVSEHNGKDVLFAIAVNNTLDSEAGTTRRVISEYDLYLNEGSILHAYNFEVDGYDNVKHNVAQIHNRYRQAEDGTATYNPADPKKNVEELVWLAGTNNPKNVTEDMIYNEDGTLKSNYTDYANDRQNATGTWVDNRQTRPTIVAQQGVPFTINFRNMVAATATEDFTSKPIRAFYVTLDEDFAVESAPSEINAWRSYSYENVGHKTWNGGIVKAHLFEGNSGQITIKELNGARGDIIGFRVYAVNYDGTLVDPDGRAFYVLVGTVTDEVELPNSIDVTVHQAAGDTASISVPEGFFSAEADTWSVAEWTKDNPYVAWGGNFHKPVAETDDDFILRGAGTAEPGQAAYSTTSMFTVKFFNGETNNKGEMVWENRPTEKTTRVQVTLNKATSMIDDEVYSIVFKNMRTNANANSLEVLQKVVVKIRKVLPTTVPELIVKAGQTSNIKPLRVKVKPVLNYPAGTWAATTSPYPLWDLVNENNVVYGQDIKPFDYADIFTNLQTPLVPYVDMQNYKFEIEGTDQKDEDEYVSTFAKYGKMDLAKNRNNVNGLVANTYTTPYVYRDRIGTGAKNVIVHYTYPGLSLTEENQRPHYEDVTVKEDYSSKFTVSYECAFRMDLIWKTEEKLYPPVMAGKAAVDAATPILTAANKEVTDAKKDSTDAAKLADTDATKAAKVAAAAARLAAAYAAQATAKANKDAADEQLANAKAEYAGLFVVKYEEDNHNIPFTALYYNDGGDAYLGLNVGTYATRAGLPGSDYLSRLIAFNILRVSDVQLNNEDYYTAVPTAGGIVLRKTRSTEEPALTADQKFKLSITLQDVFGHEHKIEYDVTMKKPELKARGL